MKIFFKILVLFFVGFFFRIIIYHYFDVNVFLDYTNHISILYYISLSSLSIYLDQFFSFNYIIPSNIESIKTFNNDLLFTKNLENNTLSNQYEGNRPLYQRIRCKLS